MKQAIRGFALGLFTATAIMLVVHYFSNSSEVSLSDMPIEEVVSEMADQGYRVLTEKEYISLSMSGEVPKENTEVASDSKQKADKETKNNAKQETETEEETKKETTSKSETDSSEKATTEKKEEEDSATKEVKSYTLTIKSGMLTSEISSALEANGIIDSSDKFISYLEDKGYTESIQLGDFKLTSDMSHSEIAEAITR